MRVVVAMSGGVDSSVAAVLLQQQGHNVIGVSMQIWGDYTVSGQRSCCSPAHLDDARAVCEQIGIPYYAIDFKKEFENKVVSYFCKEYLAGRTPSPCIPCNHELKFKALWQKAKTLDADYIATGHYARIVSQNGQFYLKKGVDNTKDQSYFLFSLTQEMLAHTLLPLGEYKKTQVRKLAHNFDLPVASKSESQEICFIPSGSYQEFLEKRCPEQFVKGDFINTQGQKLGGHKGIAFYTVGQRRGLGISASNPLYVVKINAENNTITLGEDLALYQSALLAESVHLDAFTKDFRADVKIRYRHQPAVATVYPLEKGQAKIEFDQPQRAITPGQAVVFYQGDIVLGGGWIKQAL